jgi:hypothetical protein
MTYIYLVEKCYGDVNKVYIGKSVNPQSRKNQHLKKYGREIIFNEIDKVSSFSSKDWKVLETFWIHYFKFLGFKVLNQNNGGGGSSKWNEGQRNNRKEKGIGKNLKITLSKLNHPQCSKPILQYDLKGNFIKEYPSIMEARRDNPKGDIDSCVQGKQKQAGGFQWLYKELNIKTEIDPYIRTRKSKFKTLEEKKHAKKMTDLRYYQKKKLKSITNT